MDDLGEVRASGKAPADHSEDGGCPQPIPAVEVDDIVPAAAGGATSSTTTSSIVLLLQFLEDSLDSSKNGARLDNLACKCGMHQNCDAREIY